MLQKRGTALTTSAHPRRNQIICFSHYWCSGALRGFSVALMSIFQLAKGQPRLWRATLQNLGGTGGKLEPPFFPLCSDFPWKKLKSCSKRWEGRQGFNLYQTKPHLLQEIPSKSIILEINYSVNQLQCQCRAVTPRVPWESIKSGKHQSAGWIKAELKKYHIINLQQSNNVLI